MNWFSWLSKTSLEPHHVYKYGLVFATNELEEEDVDYFNHEFLQSMGIYIAKHRLEILKQARKQNNGRSGLLVAIKKTKNCVAKLIYRWSCREDKAIVVAQVATGPRYCSRWKGSLLKRSNKSGLIADKQARLLLTNGHNPVATPRIDSLSSPMVHDGRYWSSDVKEIRWDTLFQDLKPT